MFFCQENQNQYRRRESRFWVSDPEPGPRAVLPDAGKMALAHLHAKIAMSVLDPEASWGFSDIDREKGGLSGCIGKTLVLYAPVCTSVLYIICFYNTDLSV